jgi:hypothetical protein
VELKNAIDNGTFATNAVLPLPNLFVFPERMKPEKLDKMVIRRDALKIVEEVRDQEAKAKQGGNATVRPTWRRCPRSLFTVVSIAHVCVCVSMGWLCRYASL